MNADPERRSKIVTVASPPIPLRGLRDFVANMKPVALPALLAVVFLSFHIPYLPASLEDLDSINFALGVREFNVAEHQPHPPGYPVFIFVAKAANALTGNEVVALGIVSIVAATLGAFAIAALFRRFDRVFVDLL